MNSNEFVRYRENAQETEKNIEETFSNAKMVAQSCEHVAQIGFHQIPIANGLLSIFSFSKQKLLTLMDNIFCTIHTVFPPISYFFLAKKRIFESHSHCMHMHTQCKKKYKMRSTYVSR